MSVVADQEQTTCSFQIDQEQTNIGHRKQTLKSMRKKSLQMSLRVHSEKNKGRAYMQYDNRWVCFTL